MSEPVAIIAALEREIVPLLRLWRSRGLHIDGWEIHGLRGYRCEESHVLCAGIGKAAAVRAAQAVLDRGRPGLLVSAGFAGSLDQRVAPPTVIVPSRIIDAHSGRSFSVAMEDEKTPGDLVLVSTTSILSRDAKRALASRFAAHAVDMEAAAVAEVAEAAGVPFLAVKAISDPFDFEMPPIDCFIDSAGKLNLVELLIYAAPRPRLWAPLGALGRNTARGGIEMAERLAGISTRQADAAPAAGPRT
jgi:nucleoside phosphorylase